MKQRVPHCELPQHMNKRRVNRSIKTKKGLTVVTVNPLFCWSGWRDLNARPQRPERCALAKLSHIPLRKGT